MYQQQYPKSQKYREMAIDSLAEELEAKGGKLDSCFGKAKKSIYREVARKKLGVEEAPITDENITDKLLLV